MKAMYKIILFSILLIPLIGISQDETKCSKQGGVYLTAKDFANNTFTDSICLDNEKNKIVLRGPGNTIVIISENEKRKYDEGKIYGFSDGEKKYRYYYDGAFSSFGYYSIADTNGLIIYYKRSYDPAIVPIPSDVYFYSIGYDSPMKSLTLKNLKKDFDNKEFIKEVEALKDLGEKIEDDFKINDLYKKYFK
jgi:hypothetical protein